MGMVRTMANQREWETQGAGDVLVIETEANTCHIRPVRGCPGVYVVVVVGAHIGGFRCDDPAESAIREEAEVVLDEVRVEAGV